MLHCFRSPAVVLHFSHSGSLLLPQWFFSGLPACSSLLPQWYFFFFFFVCVCPLPFWLGKLLLTNAVIYLPRTNTSSTPSAARRLSLSVIVPSCRCVVVPCRSSIEAWHCARARHAVAGSSCRRRLVAFARGRYLVAHRERGDVAEPQRSEVDVAVNAALD